MQKYRNDEIKSFEFSDLKGTPIITNDKVEAFSFKSLDSLGIKVKEVPQDTIRAERSFEEKSSFRIDQTVRQSRGLLGQEQADIEQKIEIEVQRRLEIALKKAIEDGKNMGREEGIKEVHGIATDEMNKKLDEFSQTIMAVQGQAAALAASNKIEIQEFIKRFTKWIILKEVDNNKQYLEGLLEKLILELNARRNLIIKVGKANFSSMPEVLQVVESRLGQLSNVRIEIVSEIVYPGIILESENGLINGSLEGVFQNIDKIFEMVTSHE